MRGCKKRFSVSTLTEQKITLLVRDMNGAPVDVSELNVSFEIFTVKGNELSVKVENGICTGAEIKNGLLVMQPHKPFEPGVLKVSYRLQSDNGNVIYNIAETNIDVLPSTANIGDMQSCVYADLYVEEICRDASYSPGLDGGTTVADVLNAPLVGFDVDSGIGVINTKTTVLNAIEILAKAVCNGASRIVRCDDGFVLLCANSNISEPNCHGARMVFSENGNKIKMGTAPLTLLVGSDNDVRSVSEKWNEFSTGSGGKDDVLSGLSTDNISYNVDKTMTIEQAIGIMLGRLNGGKEIRLARSSSGFIVGLGVKDEIFDLHPIIVLFDLLQGKIYWKADHAYDETMFESNVADIEAELKVNGTELCFAPDVMKTQIGGFSVESIVPVTTESNLKDILAMLINVVNNGSIRFVRTAANEMVILLKGELNIVPPIYGIKINAASGKIYFGNGDISLFDMTSSDIASESSSWQEMAGEKTSVSESWPEPLSIGPGEVLSLAESDNAGSAVQIKEADEGVYESLIFVPFLSGISFDVPDGYDMFLGTLGQAGTGNMTEYRIRWVIGENNKRVFITRILY